MHIESLYKNILNINNLEKLKPFNIKTEGAITNGQSRESDNIDEDKQSKAQHTTIHKQTQTT